MQINSTLGRRSAAPVRSSAHPRVAASAQASAITIRLGRTNLRRPRGVSG